jgi:light-regulated signal transduction histidine kinase (bacteriophytochrome)
VAVGDLVRQSLEELAPATDGRHITWEVGPLPIVQGDPRLLRQVVGNLLSNAIKYTGRAPEAHICLGTQDGAEGEAIFFVRDNGVGFDQQYAHKLFGVFQRLHRDDEFEGTGIGLATVRRIVHGHGGRVWAEGQVGEGATFFVALPAA